MAGTGKKKGNFFLRRGPGRVLFAFGLLALFLAGYSLSARYMFKTCAAQSTTDAEPYFGDYGSGNTPGQVRDLVLSAASFLSPASTSCLCPQVGLVPVPQLCIYVGQSNSTANNLRDSLQDELIDAVRATESFLGDWLVDGLVSLMLATINQAETNLIDWWDTFWFYNMRPAMQDMTKQISVNYAEQVNAMQTSGDGQEGGGAQKERLKAEIESGKELAPSEGAAVVATLVGGQQRASAIGDAMRKALQDQALAVGTNLAGTPGAAGFRASERERQRIYEEMFCDPNSNGGNNTCGASPAFPNVDTQVTKQIYSKLTIDLIGSSKTPSATAEAKPGALDSLVRTAYAGPQTLKLDGADAIPIEAVTAIIDNMVGSPAMDPLSLDTLGTSGGRERFMQRRPYLARYAAARGTPQFVASWKMPGSQMNAWVQPLRESAGVPAPKISPNPSYREVLHAMTLDRFNSGKYAIGMMTDELTMEQEKLIMGAMTSMMLRDYYLLLERQALMLAVQVAMLADDAQSPNARKDSAVRK